MKYRQIMTLLALVSFSGASGASDEPAFHDILESVKENAVNAPPVKRVKQIKKNSDWRPYNLVAPLTMSEIDDIKHQIENYLAPPAGIKKRPDMQVRLKLELNGDGVIITVASADTNDRYKTDPLYHSAVDSALKAVWRCGQIKHLDSAKFYIWRIMIVTFDPQEFA